MAQEANKIDAALAERFREQPNEYVPSTESLPVSMPSGKYNIEDVQMLKVFVCTLIPP